MVELWALDKQEKSGYQLQKTMGLDYSYRLYFHREDLWSALQGIADISMRSTLPALVIFPDHIRYYHIEGSAEKKRILYWNDPELWFVVSIYFDKDEAIIDYLKRTNGGKFDEAATNNPGGIPIGCIYVKVVTDLNRSEEKTWDSDIVLIDLSTPGTRMSMLFYESCSIRRRFQQLLENYHGICGVLNMEDDGYVIWQKGQRMDRHIPDPYLSPAEIEEFLASQERGNS